MSLYFSNIHISDTQIWTYYFIVHHIYIYINAAVSCKRYPPSLPYIIIVQTCGKRWYLPKFVDVLSVNLGFSRLLIYIYVYVVICVYNHTRDCMVSDGDVPARLGPGFAPKISHDTHEITGFPYTLVTSHVLSLSQNWIIRVNSELKSSILISRIHR